jgi:hypothetical protein
MLPASAMTAATKGVPPPTPEQEQARELFLKSEGLRIDAYAGTGKTTTLQLLANSNAQRGLYLAFNRSIAEDARQKFPPQVACATSHSIAFRGVRRTFGYPEWKLTGSLTPNTRCSLLYHARIIDLPIRGESSQTIVLFRAAGCCETVPAQRRSGASRETHSSLRMS